MEKLKSFTIDGQKTAWAPVAIRFIPQRISKKIPYPAYKAIEIWLNGKECPASCANISIVCGHQYFDANTHAIGANRLLKWLNREITDDEAANS